MAKHPKTIIKAAGRGQIILSPTHAATIGIGPHDEVGVQHVGNALVLHPAGVVPVFRDERVPAPGETVQTYDDAGEG